MIKLLESIVPICFACRYFGVSRSSYYYWKKHKKLVSLETKSKVVAAIKESFEDSKGTYGAPRIYKDLSEKKLKLVRTLSPNTCLRWV
ncbi:MAG: IS3 family transposase [Bdellovibrionota bacterium]|nr:IS3 family transposase [Bdellovibrionota bacterium]